MNDSIIILKLEFLDENEADDLWLFDLEDYINLKKSY
jgi:hypothetical protein